MSESRVSLSDRFVALAVVVSAVAVVWVLAGTTPDDRGHGTHEQLGMAVCAWPVEYGIPCPTCGCTTAASHLIHFSPWKALVTQPFGAALAAAGLAFAFVALRCLIRGESLVQKISLWPYARWFVWAIALLLGSWLYTYLTWPE